MIFGIGLVLIIQDGEAHRNGNKRNLVKIIGAFTFRK